jgi:hypothetical protein
MVCEFLDGEAAVEVLEKKEPVPVTPLARVLRKILEMADAHSSGYAMDEVLLDSKHKQSKQEEKQSARRNGKRVTQTHLLYENSYYYSRREGLAH